MSDEEDGEYRNGSNQAKTIVVRTPSWRSIKLNQLFAKLDEVRLNNNPSTGLCKERVHEEILKDVSPSDRRILPSWGFQ
ncbi:hypothetical protein INT47_004711 [Mucor saturninus]|uniref:Uncharacterized protein n=1 Tax=Mucor saturninus TaxID=64648 RepID=A0A8H7QDV8_9FUNG|nr:hypothetical protein INT47_004711 [Mucor saturninus]